MAITKLIFPQDLNPAYNPIITVVDSTNKNQTDFNFIFDVYSGCSTTNRIGRFQMPANVDGYGVFDAHRSLETKVSADIYPNLTGSVQANASFNKFNIQIGEEFQYTWNFTDNFFYSGLVGFTGTTPHYKSVGDSILVTQNPTGATNPGYDGVQTVAYVLDAYRLVINEPFGASTGAEAGTIIYSDYRKTQFTGLTATTCLYVTNAALGHQEFRNYDYHQFNINTTDQGRFLTNVPSNYRFALNSRACINAFATGSTAFGRLVIKTDTGGEYKINLTSSNYLTIGMGPYNLNNATLSSGSQPVLTSANKRYSAYTETSASAITSEVLVFDLYEKCTPYDQYQLIFLDRLGSFVSFNFDLASTKTINIDRKEFKKLTGDYYPTSNTWGYNSYDRGRTVMGVTETQQYTVNSNWVTESEAEYLKELFTSPEVYYIDSSGYWIPVIISDTSYTVKQRVKDKIFNITLQFQLAQRDEVQRG
jgi:hypothetical protein